MRGDLCPAAPAGLDGVGKLAVKRSPPEPGDVLIDRIPRQRVAEFRPARLPSRLSNPVASTSSRPPSHPRSASRSVSNRAPATAAASALARAASSRLAVLQQDRVANGLRRGTSSSRASTRPSSPALQAGRLPPAHRQLLDEEGDAAVRSWSVRARLGEGGSPSTCPANAPVPSSVRGSSAISRSRPPRRSSLRSRRSGWARGTSSDAVGADDEEPQLGQRRREVRKQLEGRCVGATAGRRAGQHPAARRRSPRTRSGRPRRASPGRSRSPPPRAPGAAVRDAARSGPQRAEAPRRGPQMAAQSRDDRLGRPRRPPGRARPARSGRNRGRPHLRPGESFPPRPLRRSAPASRSPPAHRRESPRAQPTRHPVRSTRHRPQGSLDLLLHLPPESVDTGVPLLVGTSWKGWVPLRSSPRSARPGSDQRRRGRARVAHTQVAPACQHERGAVIWPRRSVRSPPLRRRRESFTRFSGG